MARKHNTDRINVHLGTATIKQLETLQTKHDATSAREIVKKSINLFHHLDEYESRGYDLILREKDGSREQIFTLSI